MGTEPMADKQPIPAPNSPYLSRLIPMAKEVGLVSPDIPCPSWVMHLGAPESAGGPSSAIKNRALHWFEKEASQQGWPELLSYGIDEPGYPARGGHAAFGKMHEELRKIRIRTVTAMEAKAAYAYPELLDVWIIYAGQVTPELCAEAERVGAEVWTYICHLWVCMPVWERYFAGLYMWVYDLQGNTLWHHYEQSHFKHIWMRKTDKRPMPTVGWETRRDGIDDFRYLQMLEDSIAANPEKPKAREAEKWLTSLRQRFLGVNPHLVWPGKPIAVDEFDRIRARAGDYIESLGAVVKKKTGPAGKWPRGLKDEGKRFRGKTVQACMEGLRDSDYRVRRAATRELFEKGPNAAAATDLLAAQLQDARVRMPALRALEAIGARAYGAVPEIEKLITHPDGYVRLGATFALGGIAGAAPWLMDGRTAPVKTLSRPQMERIAGSLRALLKDELFWIANPAGDALTLMGPAAQPALPDVIELLDRGYDLYTWNEPYEMHRIITAIGPGAAAAVPKLMKMVEKRKGIAREEFLALAAIGPGAREVVPLLENSAADNKNAQRGTAYYALCSIRGSSADLDKLVGYMKEDKGRSGELARYLDAFGVKARAAVEEAREMLKSDLDGKIKEQLESFLRKVATGEGPTPVMP